MATAISRRDLVRDLIQLIRSDGLSIGDRLPSIRQLALQLGTKPNVVRDALMQAQTMGLIKIHPRSGAFVQSLDYRPLVEALTETLETSLLQVDHHLFHLLEARQLIETELAVQAAQRRRLQDLLPVREALGEMSLVAAGNRPTFVEHDIRFHLAVARIAGNPVLAEMLRSLLGLLRPFLTQLPFDGNRRGQTDRSHAEIYRALVDGDADAARTAMQSHLTLAYDNLLGELRMPPVGVQHG
jgi:GntR family transcriptional repressor for pyruvate dehydrogenase complex